MLFCLVGPSQGFVGAGEKMLINFQGAGEFSNYFQEAWEQAVSFGELGSTVRV